MAAFHGKGGSVTFNAGGIAEVLNWSVTFESAVEEGTAMGDTWKSRVAGFKSWTATCDCSMDSTGADPDIATDLVDSDGATLVLLTGLVASSQVSNYTGTALVIDITPSVDAEGIVRITYSFQGSGALVETIVP